MINNSPYLEDKTKFKIIYNELFSNKSIDKKKLNKTLIITFAGIPSSGKSTISKKIKERYGGIIINFDEIFGIIDKNNLEKTTDEIEETKRLFTYSLLRNSELKNKLIILDASQDREHKRFLRVCEENNLDYFIIQLELEREEAIKRFEERNANELESWIFRLSRWTRQHEEFKESTKANLVLNGKNPNIELLFNKLDKII